MKGPGIKEYLNVLNKMKLDAHNDNQLYIEITSKTLHELVSPNHATMPTCCQAIYKLLLEGDEIIRKPNGQTGFGSRLVVKFYVDNLVNRNQLYPAKKRGRPSKSEDEKRFSKLLKSNRNTADLKNIINIWLKERGWETTETNNIIQACKENKNWIINVQGSKRGRKQPLPVKLNSILNEIEDENAIYSVAFNDSTLYRKQWNEIPKVLRSKLNVSVLLADKYGEIQEVL